MKRLLTRRPTRHWSSISMALLMAFFMAVPANAGDIFDTLNAINNGLKTVNSVSNDLNSVQKVADKLSQPRISEPAMTNEIAWMEYLYLSGATINDDIAEKYLYLYGDDNDIHTYRNNEFRKREVLDKYKSLVSHRINDIKEVKKFVIRTSGTFSAYDGSLKGFPFEIMKEKGFFQFDYYAIGYVIGPLGPLGLYMNNGQKFNFFSLDSSTAENLIKDGNRDFDALIIFRVDKADKPAFEKVAGGSKYTMYLTGAVEQVHLYRSYGHDDQKYIGSLGQ